MDDTLKLTGELRVVLTNERGDVTFDETYRNLIVTAGKSWIASRMAGVASAVMSHMAVGTNNSAPAAGNTTLVAEIARVALSVAGGTPAANVVTYEATFPAGVGTGTLNEAGIFNAGAAGTMLARANIAVTKGASDGLTVTWTVTQN